MSNLSDIGFDVANIDDFRGLAEMVYYKGSGIRAGEGFYVRYKDESGAELWLQIDENKEVVGMNPHYAGSTRRKAQLLAPLSREESPMDGAFRARFQYNTPAHATPQWQEFIFDMPDAHSLPTLRLPMAVELELCAFAGEMHCYDSLEAFSIASKDASQRLPEFGPAEIPSGPAATATDEDAVLNLSGTVREVRTLHNAYSGCEFHWLRLATLGGDIDVVSDKDACSSTPVRDGFVSGRFWLSGRVHLPDHLKPRKGFLERLFWGAR